MNLIRTTLKRPVPLGLFIIILAALIFAPGFARPYTIISLINILMYVILTVSWTIFSGPTHYTSLATAAFLGIGIYVTAILGEDLSLMVTIGIGGLICFLLALGIGLLTLRLRDIYFILFTLGISELIRHVLTYWETHANQTVGRFVRGPDTLTVYHYMVVLAALTIIAAYVIRQLKIGLALKGIGESEIAAAHIGIDVTKVKVFSYAVSAVFMGATGAIIANRWSYVDPTIAFNPLNSFLPVLMAIFGGTSRLYGPILGAVVFTLLRELLITEYPYYYMLLMGATLIVVILFLPNGLLGLIDRAVYRLKQATPLRKISLGFREWRNVKR
jgi:branched-chain amino acid transport system permease protein